MMNHFDICKNTLTRISGLADKIRVSIAPSTLQHITLADLPAVEKVLRNVYADDSFDVFEHAKTAAQIASGDNAARVLEAKAVVMGNRRIDDWYAEGSKTFDIWIDFTAIIDDGFGGVIMGGAYLTDIFSYSSDDRDATLQHMFIRRFKEA